MINSNTKSNSKFKDLIVSHTGLKRGEFLNNTDSEIELKQGIIVLDKSPHPDLLYRYIEPLKKNSNPDRIIGICVFSGFNGPFKLKKSTSVQTDFIIGGEIIKNSLVLPEGLRLDNVLANGKTLENILTVLGFKLLNNK